MGPASVVTWTVSPPGGGTFGNPNAANTTFACALGAQQVTVIATVALPDSGACAGEGFTTMSAGITCEGQCANAAGCPASTTVCQTPVCNGNVCGFTGAPEGTSCSDSGGTICNGAGSCVPFTFEVARIGSGTGTITANATAVFLEQHLVSTGNLVTTVAMPTGADGGAQQPVTLTGTSVTEGDLTRSTNGRYVSLSGYAVPPGSTGLSAAPTNSTTLDRVNARVDASGNVDTSTVLSFMSAPSNTDVMFGDGNPRGTASVDGSGFWIGGNGAAVGTAYTGGIWFVPFGTAAGTITMANQVNVGPTRSVKIFGGQLYGTGDTTQTPELFAVGTGLPTTGPQTATELPGLPAVVSTGTWSFAMFDLSPSVPGLDTLYVASSSAIAMGDAGTLPLGILKFTYNGSTWSFVTSFGPTNASGALGVRGLDGLANPATNSVTLIASTVEPGQTQNHVAVFTDSGGTITAGPTVLSANETLYRGVAISPHN